MRILGHGPASSAAVQQAPGSLPMADARRQARSVRLADARRQARSVRLADAPRQARSVRLADAPRRARSVRMADARRQAHSPRREAAHRPRARESTRNLAGQPPHVPIWAVGRAPYLLNSVRCPSDRGRAYLGDPRPRGRQRPPHRPYQRSPPRFPSVRVPGQVGPVLAPCPPPCPQRPHFLAGCLRPWPPGRQAHYLRRSQSWCPPRRLAACCLRSWPPAGQTRSLRRIPWCGLRH